MATNNSSTSDAGDPTQTGVSPGLFALHNGARYRTPVDLPSHEEFLRETLDYVA
jgi:hypothetical protein